MKIISEETKTSIEQNLKNNQDAFLTISRKYKVAGVLGELRKIFPDNYIYKYATTIEGKRVWMYKICAGDKEFQKMMHAPLPGFEALERNRFKKLKEQLRNGIN